MLKFTQFSLSVLFVLVVAVTRTGCAENYNNTYLRQTPISNGIDISHLDVEICEADDDNPLDEFPEIFTVDQLRQGWVALHVFAALYLFILLAMICNDYFLPTVECICEDLNLPKDVAAATFMATATSMPEFFTNTISTLITDSDMGLGTIIGSLMFNTLGVAGVAALAINKPIQLDWWPIARDCFIYSCNTIILLILAWRGYITFIDSCIMIIFLVIYYIITFNNHRFMPTIRRFVEDKLNCCTSTRYDFSEPADISSKGKLPYKTNDVNGDGLFTVNMDADTPSTSSTADLTTQSKSCEVEDSVGLPALFAFPHDKSSLLKCWWIFTWPLKCILTCMIPNPMRYRRLYPLTFLMCIIAIGLNAYLIVWMLTAFGVAINVPTVVMGLTFLAAGSATPECVSSVISLRNGENGIGVSNSIGANSLAILLSLGVPWFIKNCINYGKPDDLNKIKIATQGIEYNIIILLICTIALFAVLSISGYRLTKKVGAALLISYVVFVVLQVLIEMNVFFPERC